MSDRRGMMIEENDLFYMMFTYMVIFTLLFETLPLCSDKIDDVECGGVDLFHPFLGMGVRINFLEFQ